MKRIVRFADIVGYPKRISCKRREQTWIKKVLIQQEGIVISVASCCDPDASLHPSRGGFPDICHLGHPTEMHDNEINQPSVHVVLISRITAATRTSCSRVPYSIASRKKHMMSASSELLPSSYSSEPQAKTHFHCG